MHSFDYVNGVLCAEGVDLRALAADAGTPTYVYSTTTIERHFRVFREAVAGCGIGAPHIFYAMKANGNLGVLMTLARLGAGADVVSEGEILKAMRAGIPAGRIVFSGAGKTEAELIRAVEAGLYQINVESEPELETLSRVAAARGLTQPIVLRVNPDIGAGGHAKITTGGAANKFGIGYGEIERLYAKATVLPGLAIKGLAVHIGSQIIDLDAPRAAFSRLVALVKTLRGQGLGVERLDLGGGIGVPYELAYPYVHGPDILNAYGAMVAEVTAGLDVEIGFEPGRVIMGNAGLLLARVIAVNARPDKRFLVVDAAMNDLVRPAMYEAYHEIWPVNAPAPGTERLAYDVVGPICETSDTFAVDRMLPALQAGDLIAFMTAGAYGASMASTYNLRPLVAEVLVDGDAYSITRKRQSIADLVGMDKAPEWFADVRSPSARATQNQS